MTLFINDNAPASPHQVTLTGTGLLATVPPRPPSDLTAQLLPEESSAPFRLAWTDNSDNESGFQIRIDTLGGGSATKEAGINRSTVDTGAAWGRPCTPTRSRFARSTTPAFPSGPTRHGLVCPSAGGTECPDRRQRDRDRHQPRVVGQQLQRDGL